MNPVDARHPDEIDVVSFSWGVANTGSAAPGGGGGAGKATFQDLQIVHTIDSATPALLLTCATGRHLAQATISHRKAGENQQDYLTIKLSDVTIHRHPERRRSPAVYRNGEHSIREGRPALSAKAS